MKNLDGITTDLEKFQCLDMPDCKHWLRARLIQARATVAVVGIPTRLLMKWRSFQRSRIGRIPIYVRSVRNPPGSELLLRALEAICRISPFWSKQFPKDISSFIVTELVEDSAYTPVDRTAFVNPWKALDVEDGEVMDIINAAFLIKLFVKAYLIRGGKGDLGICLLDKLATNAAIRFLKRVNNVSPNVYYSALINEIRNLDTPPWYLDRLQSSYRRNNFDIQTRSFHPIETS